MEAANQNVSALSSASNKLPNHQNLKMESMEKMVIQDVFEEMENDKES